MTRGATEVHDFRAWLHAQRYSPATIRNYTNYIVRARRALDIRNGVTAYDLTAYCATLSPGCAIGTRKALIAYYSFRGRARRNNPGYDIVVPPNPKRRPRPHVGAEWDALIAAARSLGGIHEVVGLMFAWTGARFASVRYARWHQFDLDSPTPTWEAVVKAANRSGPRLLTIELRADLTDVIRAWRERSTSRDWVFPGGALGGVISEPELRQVYRDIAETADVRSVPHQQRHSLATALYDQTGDPYIPQEVLGHSDANTTKGYIRMSQARIRTALEGLPAPCPQLSA